MAAGETSTTAEDYVPISQIEILTQLPTVKLSKSNFLDKLQSCTSSYTISMVNHAVENFGNSSSRGDRAHFGKTREAPAAFVVYGAVGTCVRFSENRYPIWAAEVFYRSASPTGVPTHVTDAWYSLLAKDIALKGQAKAAYVFDTGRAVVVTYSVRKDAYIAHGFLYKSEFKNVNSWSIEDGMHRFEHPLMSAVVAAGGAKYILDGTGL